MKYVFFYFLLLLSLINGYLSKKSHKIIVELIKNKNLGKIERNKINKIMYLSYEKWAMKKAHEFKKKHYYKCSRIPTDELILYSKVGLYKSILNYKGTSDFTYYSNLYIRYELLKALTDSFSLSILPKKIRMESKLNYTIEENENYKDFLTTKVKSDCSYWKLNNININEKLINKYTYQNILRETWEYINTLEPFLYRVVHLKYSYDFKVIRKNKEIGHLMCCSEEWIRQNIEKLKKDKKLKTFI